MLRTRAHPGSHNHIVTTLAVQMWDSLI